MKQWKISDRDEIIQYCYDLAKDGLFPVFCDRKEVSKTMKTNEPYLLVTDFHGKKTVLLGLNGRGIFSVRPDNVITYMHKKEIRCSNVDLNVSEEELFQNSLINMDTLEKITIQHIQYLVQYGISNYSED